MQNVVIKAVLNGWEVQVGCQTLVFVDKKLLLNELKAYMENPKKKEASVRATAINKYLLCQGVPAPVEPPLYTMPVGSPIPPRPLRQ